MGASDVLHEPVTNRKQPQKRIQTRHDSSNVGQQCLLPMSCAAAVNCCFKWLTIHDANLAEILDNIVVIFVTDAHINVLARSNIVCAQESAGNPKLRQKVLADIARPHVQLSLKWFLK